MKTDLRSRDELLRDAGKLRALVKESHPTFDKLSRIAAELEARAERMPIGCNRDGIDRLLEGHVNHDGPQRRGEN